MSEQKDVIINGKTYVLTKIPCLTAREIAMGYQREAATNAAYKDNEDIVVKLLGYVGVYLNENRIQLLTTRALIDNHVTELTTLIALEQQMLEYTLGFSQPGSALTSLTELKQIPQV